MTFVFSICSEFPSLFWPLFNVVPGAGRDTHTGPCDEGGLELNLGAMRLRSCALKKLVLASAFHSEDAGCASKSLVSAARGTKTCWKSSFGASCSSISIAATPPSTDLSSACSLVDAIDISSAMAFVLTVVERSGKSFDMPACILKRRRKVSRLRASRLASAERSFPFKDAPPCRSWQQENAPQLFSISTAPRMDSPLLDSKTAAGNCTNAACMPQAASRRWVAETLGEVPCFLFFSPLMARRPKYENLSITWPRSCGSSATASPPDAQSMPLPDQTLECNKSAAGLFDSERMALDTCCQHSQSSGIIAATSACSDSLSLTATCRSSSGA
mmetsp:Transcript_15407/g.36133  ORF Transcript_15407/g.36133 Transcript_15407/m.36133 type:complete len:330 (-) Transcript_15407:1066-2055(-)